MSRRHEEVDAVEMTRSLRDRISAEIEHMTAEEEIAWLASRKLNDPFLERLREQAARPHDTSHPR